jgi:hypothetical protein
VGDSQEQNGLFKVLFYREKHELVKYKSDVGIPLSLSQTDVIPILNKILNTAYGRKDKNLNASSDRGWFPPNRKLLSHPDFEEKETASSSATLSAATASEGAESQSSTTTIANLNLQTSAASSVLDKLLQHRMRNGGIEERKRKLEAGSNALKSMKEAKRLSSGVMVAQGIHSLDNPDLLQAIQVRRSEAAAKELEAKRKKKEELDARIEKMKAIRTRKGNSFEKYNSGELKTYIQYKKHQGDPAMPTSILQLRKRSEEIKGRASPCTSDTEDVIGGGDGDDEEVRVVETFDGGEAQWV